MNAETPLLLAAVDDHPVVLKGILWTVQQVAPWITLVAAAPSVAEMLSAGGNRADVVLLDLDLTGDDHDNDPTANIAEIRAAGPQVLVFTAELRPIPVRRAIAAGAVGLALKSDSERELIDAIRTARTGELATSSKLAYALITDPELAAHLAAREREVLDLLSQGVGRHEVGGLMEPPVATSTVLTYLKRIASTYRSLGRPTYNATDAMHHAYRDGHIDIPRTQTRTRRVR